MEEKVQFFQVIMQKMISNMEILLWLFMITTLEGNNSEHYGTYI
jgi:hypothetical protein